MLCPRKNYGTVSLHFGYVPNFSLVHDVQSNRWRPDTVFRPHHLQIAFNITRETHITGSTRGATLTHTLLLERLNLCKILIDL